MPRKMAMRRDAGWPAVEAAPVGLVDDADSRAMPPTAV